MKVSMTQANFERNLAVQQVNRLKQEIDQLSRDRHAVCIIHCSAEVYHFGDKWGNLCEVFMAAGITRHI